MISSELTFIQVMFYVLSLMAHALNGDVADDLVLEFFLDTFSQILEVLIERL